MARTLILFIVWDKKKGSERTAIVYAGTAQDAAGRYAELDADGIRDGIYKSSRSLCVQDPDGNVSTFNLHVENHPTFFASLVSFESAIAKEANHG